MLLVCMPLIPRAYEIARDQEPFRIHLKLRQCQTQLADLEGRFFGMREWLYLFVQKLNVFGLYVVDWDKKWEKTACDAMAAAVSVWRVVKDLPEGINADKIDEIFGMQYALDMVRFASFQDSDDSDLSNDGSRMNIDDKPTKEASGKTKRKNGSKDSVRGTKGR